jgi:hypothetical protein
VVGADLCLHGRLRLDHLAHAAGRAAVGQHQPAPQRRLARQSLPLPAHSLNRSEVQRAVNINTSHHEDPFSLLLL